MDLKRLRHVLAVARLGTISRAAEELHLTQPALSRSVAAFEERYGVRMFERGRSGAVLTPAGRAVVEEAEALLARAGTLEHNLALYGRGERGRVAIGMGPLIASLLLPGLGAHFLATRPGLRIRASAKAATTLLEELRNDLVEMLFCARGLVPGDADVDAEAVGDIPLALVVRAGHPLAAGGPARLASIMEFPVLSGVELSMGLEERSGAFICDNYEILRDLTLNSDGVWMSSPLLACDDLQAGRLVALPVIDDPRPPRIEVLLVKLRGRQLSPAATAVGAFVRETFTRLNQGEH